MKELVDGKVSKSIEEMTGKMDTMNARIKQEMAPRCAGPCAASAASLRAHAR